MLKPVGGSLKRNWIFAESKSISHTLPIFINYSGKIILEKPGKHHLNQMFKVDITSNKHINFLYPDTMNWQSMFPLWYSCPKMCNLNLIINKTSDEPKAMGILQKYLTSTFQKS